jgi:chromate transporter
MLSTGGFGNVPILHDELIRAHVVSQNQFAESLAVAQVSPGPNGFWVICLGYFVGGVPDAALALVAITLPPLFILGIRKLYERHRHHWAVEGFMVGLEIAVVAIFLSVMIDFLMGAPKVWLTPVTAVVGFGLTLSNRAPVALIILGSALTAWALAAFHGGM